MFKSESMEEALKTAFDPKPTVRPGDRFRHKGDLCKILRLYRNGFEYEVLNDIRPVNKFYMTYKYHSQNVSVPVLRYGHSQNKL